MAILARADRPCPKETDLTAWEAFQVRIVLLAHALLYQNGHYNEARHSLLLRRATEQ